MTGDQLIALMAAILEAGDRASGFDRTERGPDYYVKRAHALWQTQALPAPSSTNKKP